MPRRNQTALVVALTMGASAWLGLAEPCYADATAPAAPFELTWEAPPDCPDRASALASLRALSGPSPAVATRASVRIARDERAAEFHAEVQTGAGADVATRSLTGATCSEVAHAALVVVAIALEPPSAAPTAPTASPLSTPGTPPPAAPPSARQDAPEAAGAPSPRAARARSVGRGRTDLRMVFGARALFDVGLLGGPAFGVGASAGVNLGAWRLDATFSLLPGRSFTGPLGRFYGGSVALAAGGARSCYTPRFGVFELGVCGAFELGALTVDAGITGLPRTHASDLWFGASLALAPGFVLLPWLAIRTEIGAGVTVVRTQFELVDQPRNLPLFSPAPVFLRTAVAVELRF